MKFIFDTELREWKDPTIKLACVDNDLLINCFLLNEKTLFLATQKATVMLDIREKGAKLKPHEVQSLRANQFKRPGAKNAEKSTDFRQMTRIPH